MVMTPDVTPGPRKTRLDAGDALPHLLDPLRSICSELSPLHFISVVREVCKLMHVVGISPGESLAPLRGQWSVQSISNSSSIAFATSALNQRRLPLL